MQNSHGELRMEKKLQRIISEFSVQQEVSLVEGMKELMPIYHVIGKIPTCSKYLEQNK